MSTSGWKEPPPETPPHFKPLSQSTSRTLHIVRVEHIKQLILAETIEVHLRRTVGTWRSPFAKYYETALQTAHQTRSPASDPTHGNKKLYNDAGPQRPAMITLHSQQGKPRRVRPPPKRQAAKPPRRKGWPVLLPAADSKAEQWRNRTTGCSHMCMRDTMPAQKKPPTKRKWKRHNAAVTSTAGHANDGKLMASTLDPIPLTSTSDAERNGYRTRASAKHALVIVETKETLRAKISALLRRKSCVVLIAGTCALLKGAAAAGHCFCSDFE